MSKPTKTFEELYQESLVPISVGKGGEVEFAVDMRKMSGEGKTHDVTHGPCCCGAWHKGEVELG